MAKVIPVWKKILFGMFPVLILLAAVELILNLVYGRPLTFALDYELLYRPVPNQYAFPSRYSLPRAHVNSLGIRGGELRAAPANRILVLGDSHTFGVGLRDDETFPAQLERHLAGLAAGDVEVLNCGVGGYGLFQEVGLLRARDLGLRPQALVLLYALSQVYRQPLTSNSWWRLRMYLPFRYLTSYHVLKTLYIDAMAGRGISVYTVPTERETRQLRGSNRMEQLWARERPPFEDLSQTCSAGHIDVVVIAHGSLDDPNHYLERQLAELCRGAAVPLFRFAPQGLSGEYFVPRDGHFSALYYARLIKALAEEGLDRRLLASRRL